MKAPLFVMKKTVESFIEKHTDWIKKRMDQEEQSLIDKDKIHEYKKLARQVITQKVQYFAKKYGFEYNSIRITSARTRWGSCTSQKNLNFSYKLVLTPDEAIDYVVVHELCHLRQMNHSAKFWKEVESILPDYQVQNKWLKTH